MELFSLSGKVALVTGACGLLGRKHCQALAHAGARVVVADLDQGQASSLANSLGDNHMGVALNVANEYSIREAKDLVLKKYETIDVLVNNAAINDMFESPQLKEEQSRFENYPLAMWQQALEVNVTGVFLCSQIIGSVLADKGQGSIINIASTYGITAPDQTLRSEEHTSE